MKQVFHLPNVKVLFIILLVGVYFMPHLLKAQEKSTISIIGNAAPDLHMQDANMQPVALSDIKSKYIVVFFWDVACNHCRKEVPKLDALYREVKDKYNLEIYAVSLDGNKDEWTDYINDNNLDWVNVWDPNYESNFRKLYDVYSSPVIYLLDKDRKIIAKPLNTEQLNATLLELYTKDQNSRNERNSAGTYAESQTSYISIYPNPAVNQLQVRLTGADLNFDGRISITNVLGEGVQTLNVAPITRQLTIDISKLTSGIYFLCVHTESGNVVRKFVKQ